MISSMRHAWDALLSVFPDANRGRRDRPPIKRVVTNTRSLFIEKATSGFAKLTKRDLGF